MFLEADFCDDLNADWTKVSNYESIRDDLKVKRCCYSYSQVVWNLASYVCLCAWNSVVFFKWAWLCLFVYRRFLKPHSFVCFSTVSEWEADDTHRYYVENLEFISSMTLSRTKHLSRQDKTTVHENRREPHISAVECKQQHKNHGYVIKSYLKLFFSFAASLTLAAVVGALPIVFSAELLTSLLLEMQRAEFNKIPSFATLATTDTCLNIENILNSLYSTTNFCCCFHNFPITWRTRELYPVAVCLWMMIELRLRGIYQGI